MESVDHYKITEEDYQSLEDTFRKQLSSILLITADRPDLQNLLEEFVVSVGTQVKGLLQKYHTDYKIKELEAEDTQNQLMDMKRKQVKMELQFKQIEHAINGFNRLKRS